MGQGKREDVEDKDRENTEEVNKYLLMADSPRLRSPCYRTGVAGSGAAGS